MQFVEGSTTSVSADRGVMDAILQRTVSNKVDFVSPSPLRKLRNEPEIENRIQKKIPVLGSEHANSFMKWKSNSFFLPSHF